MSDDNRHQGTIEEKQRRILCLPCKLTICSRFGSWGPWKNIDPGFENFYSNKILAQGSSFSELYCSWIIYQMVSWYTFLLAVLASDLTGYGQLAVYPNNTRLPFQMFCLKIGSGQSPIFILIRTRFPHASKFSNWVDQRWCLSGILFQVVLISRVDEYKSTL